MYIGNICVHIIQLLGCGMLYRSWEDPVQNTLQNSSLFDLERKKNLRNGKYTRTIVDFKHADRRVMASFKC